ncbi:MAG: D-alanine--D-alanine ligase [Ignavibacteriae bacterium]|nr:D-alanine--D-alanine ligase [Ignavibacteriota bacterium]MCB9244311.1 D-alanine--D-alanine ligase [Ignavibacteriales bacterium]
MNIVLLTGGLSSEREVSLTSGKSIAAGLREAGHNVRVVDPIYGDKEVSEEKIFENTVKRDYPTAEALNELKRTADRNIITCINSKLFDNTDIVFLGLHGKLGEDGRIQTLLEMRGLKYTGSGILPSGIALDKNLSKILFRYYGIPTPEWMVIEKSSHIDHEEVNKLISSKIGFPNVVKPIDEGSTVGLTIVQPDVEDVELPNALETAFKYSDRAIIEQYIKGRELTVTIMGKEAYPVIEIRPKDGFYDYEHKYTKGMTEYICPAELSKETEEMTKKYAMLAHKVCGCSVYSRVDFIMDENGNVYCLEVNTLPGMTSTSLVPKSANALGMSFSDLLNKIIELSLMH